MSLQRPPISCPLQWLPVLLADASPTNRRRLVDNVFTTKGALQTAVREYDDDVAAAEATYGPIADWNVSAITDMRSLFNRWSMNYGLRNFNVCPSAHGTVEGCVWFAGGHTFWGGGARASGA